ncbi:MAG: hypothetical protein ICV70_00635 [Jiangellaceae bacterium]|nr:hypothetical protein [Jiangellaceae bacterium]
MRPLREWNGFGRGNEVFVAAADDIAGIRSARELAERLALRGRLREGPFVVDVFDTPSGIASPIRRILPGFVGGGRTAGAREFVIPTLARSQLLGRAGCRHDDRDRKCGCRNDTAAHGVLPSDAERCDDRYPGPRPYVDAPGPQSERSRARRSRRNAASTTIKSITDDVQVVRQRALPGVRWHPQVPVRRSSVGRCDAKSGAGNHTVCSDPDAPSGRRGPEALVDLRQTDRIEDVDALHTPSERFSACDT